MTKSDTRGADEIARALRAEYAEQLAKALRRFAAVERQRTRASHEVHRLEKHLAKIDEFCRTNNVKTA